MPLLIENAIRSGSLNAYKKVLEQVPERGSPEFYQWFIKLSQVREAAVSLGMRPVDFCEVHLDLEESPEVRQRLFDYLRDDGFPGLTLSDIYRLKETFFTLV